MKCHCGNETFKEYRNLVGLFRACLKCGFPTLIKSKSLGVTNAIKAAKESTEAMAEFRNRPMDAA